MFLLDTLQKLAESYHSLTSNQVHVYDEVTSTNDIAQQLLKDGVKQGIVLALKQTKGRGRNGRVWQQSSGLAISLIIDLTPMPKHEWAMLTVATGVALVEALRALGLEVAIKWPNDVLLAWPTPHERYGLYRKVAGILVEGSGVGSELEAAIVGIGINTGSGDGVDAALGAGFIGSISSIAPEIVFEAFLKRMNHIFSIADKRQYLLHAMKDNCVTIGKKISFLHDGKMCEGKAVALNNDFSLLIELASGETMSLYAGEVYQV